MCGELVSCADFRATLTPFSYLQILFRISDFPVKLSRYTSCRIHHVF